MPFPGLFPGEEWNLSKWSNKTYDALIEKGMSEADAAKRAAIYVDAQKEMDKDAFAIWLTHGVRVVAYGENVETGPLYPDGRGGPLAGENEVIA